MLRGYHAEESGAQEGWGAPVKDTQALNILEIEKTHP